MKTNSMRLIVVGLCLLLGTLSMQAARLKGIRVESAAGAVVVYVNGEQVCSASGSCFIANLASGYYEIQVYDARSSGREERGRRDDLLFDERVYYSGQDVKEVFVRGNSGHRPSRPDIGYRPDEGMSRDTFEAFYRSVKKLPFASDQTKLIETALLTTGFTSEQCRRLVELYSFDSEKVKVMQLIYPRILDKEGFFVVIEGLTFTTDKNKMNDFVKQYHSRRN